MTHFFENVDPETASELDQLSRLIYELRENHNAILRPYGAADAPALLQQIETGTTAEHPAYEHYLAARIITDTRETVRTLIAERGREANRR